jgi:capsular exopolysaccharide synthesis family protein
MSRTYEALKRAENLRSGAAATGQRGVAAPGIATATADEDFELRQAMTSVNIGGEVKTVAVSSSLHGEGTSSVAWLLARAAAANGRNKVLLVDMNFRTPSLWRMAQAGSPEGVMNVISGEKTLDQVIQDTAESGVRLVTAGTGGDDAIVLLERADMPALVKELASHADLVFIDVPPFALYPDAATVAGAVDGVVLVVEADSTPVAVASRTIEAVRKAGGEVLGSVLNKRREYIPVAISELVA